LWHVTARHNKAQAEAWHLHLEPWGSNAIFWVAPVEAQAHEPYWQSMQSHGNSWTQPACATAALVKPVLGITSAFHKVLIAGADQVTLDGVYHSPLGSVIAVDGKVGRPWYGSPEVLPKWIHHISCNESDSMVEVGHTLPPNL